MATHLQLHDPRAGLLAFAVTLATACGGATFTEKEHGATGVEPAQAGTTTGSTSAGSPGPGSTSATGSSTTSGTTMTPADRPTEKSYPGSGFVVHEWGTNTVVVGSDGSLQRGLHHEGDDLPAFVYDRTKQGTALTIPSVDKMETPVDYFYSDQALEAKVSVDLPEGVLTQWYPAVSSFAPPVLMGTATDLIDPVFAVNYPYTAACSGKYGAVAGGKLDWGTIEVLPPAAAADSELPEAPLDRFTWSYARQVKANTIRVKNPSSLGANGFAVKSPQAEKFLFYRGLGNFPSPARITAASDATKSTTVRLANLGHDAVGTVFVLNVSADRGAFHVRTHGVAGGGIFDDVVPSLAEGRPIDDFVGDLATAMTQALVAAGLYTDESVGMVNTWRRQWFSTPGVRVLYFAPPAWIDAQVPLVILPKPTDVVRVMVMRVEVLTPQVEADDRAFAALLDGTDANFVTGQSHFTSLGRFAEPRLRRALAVMGSSPPRAQKLLSEIEAPNASFAVGQ